MQRANTTVNVRSARQWIAVVAVLLVCFAVTVRDLDAISLWNDETWTVDATDPDEPVTHVTDRLREDVHPPLFFAELYLWRQFTGQSAFEMRYFSVLLTLLTAAVIVAAGRALFSPPAGWIAALFFALHDLVLVYTQEVRHYSQLMLVAALAIWLYWRFWRRPTRSRGFAFVIAGAALLWTHYWGGFVLLALAIHAGIMAALSRLKTAPPPEGESSQSPDSPSPRVERESRGEVRPFVWAFVAIGLLFVPWVPSLLHQMTVERPGGLPHSLDNSWVVFKSLAFVLLGLPEVLWILLAVVGAIGVYVGGAYDVRTESAPPQQWAAQGLPRSRGLWAASLLPALVVVMPVGLTVLLNTVYPSLSPRSLSLIIPALALLIGHALASFGTMPRAVLVVFMVWYGLTTTSALPTNRAPWPDVAQFLADRSTNGDIILLELKNRAWNNLEEYTFAYYYEQAGGDVPVAWSEAARLESPETFGAWLDDHLAGANGVWVAKWGWPESLLRDNLQSDLRARGFVASAPVIAWEPFTGEPVETWRFDRLPAGASQVNPANAADVYTVFGDQLVLLKADVGLHAESGVITVNLLWTPTGAPDRTYTVSVFLLDDSGALIAQHDSYPFEGRSPTSAWMPGRLYFDSHVLDARSLTTGEATVGVKVYSFTDETFSAITIAPPSDCSDDPACEFVIVDTVSD